MTILARLFGNLFDASPRQFRSGRVVRHFIDRGFGFVADDATGEQFFLHCSHINAPLRDGLLIQFTVGHDARGRRRAENARLIVVSPTAGDAA